MPTIKRTLIFIPVVALLLAGCDLFSGGQAAAPPPPPEALQSNPIPSATPAPTATPGPDGRANRGEIVFTRDGQLRAIGPDGTNERALTAFPPGSVLRDLTISPDGRYLAFSLNAAAVMVQDLTTGVQTLVDQAASGNVGRFAWSPASDMLYYHKLVLDANGLPSVSEIWRVALLMGSAPERLLQSDLASGPATAPAFVLADGKLIFHQFDPAAADMGTWLVYIPVSGESSPLLPDYGLWDVSPDSASLLLFEQADVTPGQQRIPVPLYTTTLADRENVVRVSPEGEDSAYWLAHFAPDNSRIVALRYVAAGGGFHGAVVLLQPDPQGNWTLVQLAPDASAEDVAFCWHGEDGVVVQRLRPGAASAELWLLPLDGSPGRLLTSGEQPVVVGGR